MRNASSSVAEVKKEPIFGDKIVDAKTAWPWRRRHQNPSERPPTQHRILEDMNLQQNHWENLTSRRIILKNGVNCIRNWLRTTTNIGLMWRPTYSDYAQTISSCATSPEYCHFGYIPDGSKPINLTALTRQAVLSYQFRHIDKHSKWMNSACNSVWWWQHGGLSCSECTDTRSILE
jgi:hypothetical protein